MGFTFIKELEGNMVKQLIKVGKGTLYEFKEEYNFLENKEDIRIKASTLFLVGDKSGTANVNGEECTQIYEYVIYYDAFEVEGSTTGDKEESKESGPEQLEEIELVM